METSQGDSGIIGKQIGNYRVIDELGSGAFGRVYRGSHVFLTQRAVAIKLLHTVHLSSAQEREGFLQEARFLEMIKHPYILPVLDVGLYEGLPYLVADYAPGGSLRDRINQAPSHLLSTQDAARILSQVGQALAHAHRQQVIHRDLKPENILFNSQGDALLADFGIATMLGTASIKYSTIIGTPPYMAPEQFQGVVSKESDQYSLGCIAYELFTGTRPFTAPDIFSMGFKHMNEAPVPPSQSHPGIPAAIEQVILKAMAKRREDRFPNVEAFTSVFSSYAGVAVLSTTEMNAPTIQSPGQAANTEDPTVLSSDAATLVKGTPSPVSAGQPPLRVMSQTQKSAKQQPALNSASTKNMPSAQPPTVLAMPTPDFSGSETQVAPPTTSGMKVQTEFPQGIPAFPPPQRRRKRKWVLALILLLTLLLCTGSSLYASAKYGLFGSGQKTNAANNHPPLATSGKASVTITPTKPAPTSTPTARSQTQPQPQSPPQTQPVSFSVAGVNVSSVSTNNFNGVCTNTMTFTFTAIITVPANTAGGTVGYTWLQSDGTTNSPETAGFAPGATTQTVTTTRSIGYRSGDGSALWEALQITTPNSITSTHTSFSFVCQFKVTNIMASVSPNSSSCPYPYPYYTLSFSAIFTISPSPTVGSITYTWARSDGATMSPITISVPANQTTVTVTGPTWQLGTGAPVGSYWEHVVVTTPNSSSSNQAIFTKTC